MIDSLDAAAEAHLTQTCATLAACLKITLINGTVFGFTNYSQDLIINGVTFSSMSGQNITATETSTGFSVDSIDIETLKVITGIPVASILSGLFDHASFDYFLVNYLDFSMNFGILRRGKIGKITNERSQYAIELRGMMEAYKKRILDLYTAQCIVDLGDAKCKVQLNPPVWTALTGFTIRASGLGESGGIVKPTAENRRHFKAVIAGTSGASEPSWDTVIGNTTVDGTVTWEAIQSLFLPGVVEQVSTATHRIFIDNSMVELDDFFLGGKLTWLTGDNANRSFEVKRFKTVNSNKELELILSTFLPIKVGDTYTIQAGCSKRKDEDCIAKFDNIVNFRGYPLIPQNFQIVPGKVEGKDFSR